MPLRHAHRRGLHFVVLFAGFARSVAAQSVGENTVPAAETRSATDVARDLFHLGLGAAGGQRWNDALEYFARAYALVPEPSILFNLAAMQSRTGHVRAASESYRRFLHDVTSGPLMEQRGLAQDGLREAEHRIATLRIHRAAPWAASDRVLLDGTVVAPDVLHGPIALDPGEHSVILERAGTVRVRARAPLAEGQSLDLALDDFDATVGPPPPRPPVHHGLSPWVPIGIALGVCAVGGGITALVLGTSAPPATTLPPLTTR